MSNPKLVSSYQIKHGDRIITPLYANACGNTFLIYDLTAENVKKTWDRVRSDIWDLLKTASVDDALALEAIKKDQDRLQVNMHVLEPDGTQADFCGNGARSVGHYLMEKYGVQYRNIELVSRKGVHDMQMEAGTCFIDMGTPEMQPSPLHFEFEGKEYEFYLVDVSERHLVTRDAPWSTELLTRMGLALNKQWNDRFPHGINLNAVIVPQFEENRLQVMTFERGVYRITQSCGTGSVGSCQVAINNLWINPNFPHYRINTLGGELRIKRDENNRLWLGGNVLFNSTNIT